jgi:hypothetical protein
MIRTIAVVALASFGGFVWFDPGLLGLQIRTIEVHGCHYIATDSISVITEEFIGEDLSLAICRSLEDAVEEHPLVLRSTADRSVDGSITLHIEERKIIAALYVDSLRGIDEQGISHPVLSTPDSLPKVIDWVDNDAFWMSAISLFDRVYTRNPALLQRSLIRVDPDRSAVIVEIAHMPGISLWLPCPADEHLESRIDYFSHVIADTRLDGEHPGIVDLRWRNQIIVTDDQRDEYQS